MAALVDTSDENGDAAHRNPFYIQEGVFLALSRSSLTEDIARAPSVPPQKSATSSTTRLRNVRFRGEADELGTKSARFVEKAYRIAVCRMAK